MRFVVAHILSIINSYVAVQVFYPENVREVNFLSLLRIYIKQNPK